MSGHASLIVVLALLGGSAKAGDPRITIRADFPGGNVTVVANDGERVTLQPDLRGGDPWFYWHFEAESLQPGRVTFHFPGAPRIGVRGPAFSRDGGRNWQWLGVEAVTFAPPNSKPAEDRFSFAFTKTGEKVRFAVAIPYVQRDLDGFLKSLAANSHVTRSVLTHTRVGRRPVELLQVGKAGRSAMLLTARHHACESMASYVLEGFVQEAASESPAGMAFRQKYTLYVVPFVDTDGVEQGDQGKGRHPHDHNRDYGKDAIYPEVRAIQDLAERVDVRHSLDLHCPFLRGDIHEVFHFLGLGVPHIKGNVDELIAWLREERPPVAAAPLNFLVDAAKPNAANPRINSHHFTLRKNAVMAATLEIPYAQPTCPLDAALAREYGGSLLRAWVRTKFTTDDAREAEAHARLAAFRTEFLRSYRGKPKEAEMAAVAYLNDPASPAVYRAEANGQMALLRLQQRQFGEAKRFADAVIREPGATTLQREAAFLRRAQAVCGDPTSTAMDVEAAVRMAVPYPSDDFRSKVFEAAGEFHERKAEFEMSLEYARKQLPVAASYERGKMWNRIAALQERLRRPDDAVASRKEAVKVLMKQLDPVPVGVFGALMAGDLLEALQGIPTATRDEKRKAAVMVLDHKVASPVLKAKAMKVMEELEKPQ